MKKILLILYYLIFTISLFSDEPPGWFEFYQKSENGLFKAEVFALDDNPNYDSNWFYKVIDDKGEIVHQGNYKHDGYYSTLLTNNGKYFLYINSWFDKDALIYIYSSQGLKVLTNRELKVNFLQLRSTVSHKVWLDEYYLDNDKTLVIDFYIGFNKKVDLETGKLNW